MIEHRSAKSQSRSCTIGAAFLLSWTFALVHPSALAQKPPNITAGEMALLPEYCPDTQGFNYGDQYSSKMSPRANYWVGLMGTTFWHHHHYCWGLIKMQRARRPGQKPEIRRGGFVDAIGDFDYVVRNGAPDFVLLPEVLLRMGDAYAELGEIPQALEAYEGAVKRKPDYWPAYVNAAAMYEKVGLKKQALARIALGLNATPDEPVLQEHYKRLGGDLPSLLKSLRTQPSHSPSPVPGTASAASTPAPR